MSQSFQPRPAGLREQMQEAGAPRKSAPASQAQWEDWQWHVRNRITSVSELERWLPLTVEEKRAIQFSQGRFQFSLTPYWASIMDPNDFFCPIRHQAIPLDEEFRASFYEHSDFTAQPTRLARGRLTHAYADRAVLTLHSQCIVYCRFCPQRSIAAPSREAAVPVLPARSAGDFGRGAQAGAPPEVQALPTLSEEDWMEVLLYLKHHPQIQEVILSGGEPLLFNDETMERTFLRLKSVPSIKTLRLETRILSVLPQRVTPQLASILKNFQPLYLVVHINHPREITPEFSEACARLIDSGVPLASQTVLLRDVNDRPQVLAELFSSLFKLRVRPYRLVQCLPSKGADHFRTTISMGLRLMESLRGRMAGLVLPEYVVDTPGGKIPLLYESILARNRKRVLLKNYEGKVYVYPEKVFAFPS